MSPSLEHYRRESDGSWRYQLLEAGDAIHLTGDVALGVDTIYAGAFELPAE